MARAALNTADILKINGGKIHTFVIVSPDSTDEDDVELFVVQPPPAVRDAAHRAPVDSMTQLCSNCRGAFEYVSYFFDVLMSGGNDAVEKIPPAYLLHTGAQALQEGENFGCHLCVLIMANIRTKWLAMGPVNQSNIEMSWQKESGQPWPARIHFALTHGSERSAANYWNFFKLKVWPGSEFDVSLFGVSKSASFTLSSSTGSEQSRDRAVQWLSRCQANEDGRHAQCNRNPEDWLPTRLLDVERTLKTSKLKVVVPNDDPDAFASQRQYITLSHCWGRQGATAMPVLTTKNLEERQTAGLDLSLLPKTFKDALEIAQWFQVRWLWIDSLCILQDSREDWDKEAVMMYNVYKNALLNISADDSNDPRLGCFRNREPIAICPMRLRLGSQDPKDSKPSTCWLTPDSNALFEGTSGGPLAKRAWVFQERQLSRRVLHFTSTELIWECCAEGQYFASETFPDGAPLKTTFSNKPKFQSQCNITTAKADDLYKTWDLLSLIYSEKSLSHIEDKAVALSGLAQEFQAALPNDTYVSGLWRSTLPQSLLWQSADPCGRIKSDAFIAPSWSWLSMEGSISSFASRGTDNSVVQIINIATEPVIPTKHTASLRSASLDLRCYLRPVEVKPDYEKKEWYLMAHGGGQRHKVVFTDRGLEIDLGSNRSFTFDVPYDENSGPASVSGHFLPICIQWPSEDSEASGTSETIVRGLLIEPLNEDLTQFRRIGTISLEGSHCLRLLYKLENDGNENLWNSLQELLGSNYKSFDMSKAVGADSSGKVSNSALSSILHETGAEGSEVDGEKNAESPVESKEQPTVTETVQFEGKGREREKGLFGPGTNKEGGMTAAQLSDTPDLDTMDPLERLYALDEAFYGSPLEAHFQRLAPHHITLI